MSSIAATWSTCHRFGWRWLIKMAWQNYQILNQHHLSKFCSRILLHVYVSTIKLISSQMQFVVRLFQYNSFSFVVVWLCIMIQFTAWPIPQHLISLLTFFCCHFKCNYDNKQVVSRVIECWMIGHAVYIIWFRVKTYL